MYRRTTLVGCYLHLWYMALVTKVKGSAPRLVVGDLSDGVRQHGVEELLEGE